MKNLYNLRNHQNITEIRDVISKYGENAKINLGGIPMIADDMMSYIKNDIVVFGIGVFVFIIFTLVHLKKYKMGFNAFSGMFDFGNCNDWPIRINWMESNCDFLKFYCFNVDFKYGDEYSCNRQRFLQLKNFPIYLKESHGGLISSKKMMLPILYTVLTTIVLFYL